MVTLSLERASSPRRDRGAAARSIAKSTGFCAAAPSRRPLTVAAPRSQPLAPAAPSRQPLAPAAPSSQRPSAVARVSWPMGATAPGGQLLRATAPGRWPPRSMRAVAGCSWPRRCAGSDSLQQAAAAAGVTGTSPRLLPGRLAAQCVCLSARELCSPWLLRWQAPPGHTRAGSADGCRWSRHSCASCAASCRQCQLLASWSERGSQRPAARRAHGHMRHVMIPP